MTKKEWRKYLTALNAMFKHPIGMITDGMNDKRDFTANDRYNILQEIKRVKTVIEAL